MPRGELSGKVAWITGGGSGIGLAGAEELVKAGARVVISGRTEKTNREAEKKLKSLGDAEAVQLEVSDKKAVAAAAADIEKRHGRIDILVTSAGTNISGPKRNFKTMSVEGWDDVVQINLNGLFYCCHAVIPGMRARRHVEENLAASGRPLTAEALEQLKAFRWDRRPDPTVS